MALTVHVDDSSDCKQLIRHEAQHVIYQTWLIKTYMGSDKTQVAHFL